MQSLLPTDRSGSEPGLIAWYENETGESGADADEFGSEQIIAEEDGVAYHAFAADADGDGDKDIFATYGDGGTGEQSLVWYENQIDEGTGFSTENVIDGSLTLVESLHVADLDGGGNDVIIGYGKPFDDATKLVWYENTDGNGSFAAEAIIDDNLGDDAVISLTTAAVDADSDPDIVAGLFDSGPDDKIVWYGNQLSEGSGFVQTEVTSAVERPLGLYTADLNNSGNPDLISASRDDDKVAWYENTGGAFTPQTIIASSDQGTVQGAVSVTAADINGDTETDVLSAATGFERIAWYENIDGVLPVELTELSAMRTEGGVQLNWTTASETNNAGFEVQHTESVDKSTDSGLTSWTTLGFVEGAGTTDQSQSYTFTAEDLGAGTHRFRLRQVDTDGTESFSEPVEVKVGLDETYTLSNAHPTPTPSQATLELAVQDAQSVTAEVYDVMGRRVRTVHNEEVPAERGVTLDVDASTLSSGTYFVRVEGETFTATRRLTVVR